jgi:hypothetical protein
MGFLIALPIVAFVFFILPAVLSAASRKAGALGGAVVGRGLVLSASRYAGETLQWGKRMETRKLTLDVEVPGAAPFEVTVTPAIPRFCEALPGSVLDVRVNPRSPQGLTVIGPAGASDWLQAAPWLSTGGMSRGAGGAPTMVRVILALVALPLLAGFFGAILKPHTPVKTPSAFSVPKGPQCQAAQRCCTTIGNTSCAGFGAMTEAQCGPVLAGERKAATKLGKRCP